MILSLSFTKIIKHSPLGTMAHGFQKIHLMQTLLLVMDM